MDDLTFIILRVVTTAVALVIAYYVVPALKVVVQNHIDENVTGFINACVYAAQQQFKPEDGAIKKNYVLKNVREWLQERGIEITEEQLNILIESAVLDMKAAIK